jgi:hypothetical protein
MLNLEGVRVKARLVLTARTVGLQIRIPLRAGMYVRVFLYCLVLCKERCCNGADPPSKKSYQNVCNDSQFQKLALNQDRQAGSIR